MCLCVCVCVSRRLHHGEGPAPRGDRQAAAAGGTAAGEGVAAGGHLPGPEEPTPGRAAGWGEGRHHAEVQDAGGVEEAAGAAGTRLATEAEEQPGRAG